MKKLQYPQIIPTHSIPFHIKEEEVKKYLAKIPRQITEIVFFGSDPWSTQVLQALEDNFDVKAVVTALNSDKLDKDSLTADLFVVASYGKILPKALLDIPRFGALNLHPSLLPKYRGPSPVPTTILSGDKVTGVTIIKMDEKMDHGPVVITKEISLSGQETFPELINKLFQVGAELLVGIIPDFAAGKIKAVPQNHSQATFTRQLSRKDGYFDISNPPDSQTLDRMIRAYYPWPGVWTKWNDKIVKFLPEGLIQMEGKKPVPFKIFLNGYPDFPLKSITLDKK